MGRCRACGDLGDKPTHPGVSEHQSTQGTTTRHTTARPQPHRPPEQHRGRSRSSTRTERTACDPGAPPDQHIMRTDAHCNYIYTINSTHPEICVLTGPYWTPQDVQYQHPICLNSRTPCSMCGGFIYHFSNKMPIIHPHVHLRCAVSSSNITNVTPACDNHSDAGCGPDLTVTI